MFFILPSLIISSTQSTMYLSMYIFEDIHSIPHIKVGYVMDSDRFPSYIKTIYEVYSHKSNNIINNILSSHYIVYEITSNDLSSIPINKRTTIESLLRNTVNRIANIQQQFYDSFIYLLLSLLSTPTDSHRQRYRFAYESDKAISNNETYSMSNGENMFIYDFNQQGIVKINDIDFMIDIIDESIYEFENIFINMFSNEFNIKRIDNVETINNELKQMNELSKINNERRQSSKKTINRRRVGYEG